MEKRGQSLQYLKSLSYNGRNLNNEICYLLVLSPDLDTSWKNWQIIGAAEASIRWHYWLFLNLSLEQWLSSILLLTHQKNRKGNGTQLQHSCLENPMDGGAWWATVHRVTKSRTRLSDFTFTFHFHALEKEMATHSSVLAWRIPGMREPHGLPSMGSHRVGHDWSDLAAAAAPKEIHFTSQLSIHSHTPKVRLPWNNRVTYYIHIWYSLFHCSFIF